MIPIAAPFLGEEEKNNVVEAVESGWVSSKGKFINEFEEKFASYCQMPRGIATSNGTAALHLALKALDVKEGDEVILPSLTFIATANSVLYCNAKPVFVDSHPDYWCIDPEKIEEAITPKTKAIIPVHLYGHPCDMDPIMSIAKKHGISVIEDCAQAHGAIYKGRIVGSIGDINCFSFFGNKLITTGEGGMCLTRNTELADRMRSLRNHGRAGTSEYKHEMLGYNYRMTNMQAALGVAQTEKIGKILRAKKEIEKWYNDILTGTVTLPPQMEWAEPICWIYTILTDKKEEMTRILEKNDIETRSFFLPIHQQPFYKNNISLPVAETLFQKGLSLPSFVRLKKEQVEAISRLMKTVSTG